MIMLNTVFICVFVTYVSPAFSSPINSDDYVPCESGWYYFRDKCYNSWGREPSERLSWHDALAQCKSYGADLASIQSKEEQDFVAAYPLRNASWWAWIGLNDFDDLGNFKWTDGSVFNYSAWFWWNPLWRDNFGEPGYCVLMNMYRGGFGPWSHRNCNGSFAYICEKNANKEVSSQNPMFCSSEDGGGWKSKNSCYHVIQEKKSWDNAEKYCEDYYNGHLLTIHDIMEDDFLDLAIPDIKKDMWIGIKMENLPLLKWTSGWFVAYKSYKNTWKTVTEGYCAARSRSRDWVTIPCSKELPFICEVSKESAPVLKPPSIGAHCPEKQDYWRDFGGEYCYHFEPGKFATFDEAKKDCIRRGGHVCSLHSQGEAEILQPLLKDKRWRIHIGLHRKAEDNGTFVWVDGSELDYQNCVDGEPENVEEPLFENRGGPDKVQELCVEMWMLTKKWNVIPCNKVDVGYVCSVKKIVSESNLVDKTTSIETDVPTIVSESNLVDKATSIETDVPTIVSESNLVDKATSIETDVPTIVSESNLVDKTTSVETDIPAIVSASNLVDETTSIETQVPTIVSDSNLVDETTSIETDILTMNTFDDEQPLNSTSEEENFARFFLFSFLTFGEPQEINESFHKEMPTFGDEQPLNSTSEEESFAGLFMFPFFTIDDTQEINESFHKEMPTFDDEQPLTSTSEKEMTTFDDEHPSNSTFETEMPTFDDKQPLNSIAEKEMHTFDDEQLLNLIAEKESLTFDDIQALNASLQEEILTFDALNSTLQKERLTFYDILTPNATLQKETLAFVHIGAFNATLQNEMPASDNKQPLKTTSEE